MVSVDVKHHVYVMDVKQNVYLLFRIAQVA